MSFDENNVISEQEEFNILDEFKIDFSFDFKQSNLFNLLLFVITSIISISVFGLIWNFRHIWNITNNFIFNSYITIPVIVAGIIVHEILHALPLLLFSNIKIKNLKIGVNWYYLTPYVHCKFPVLLKIYRLSSLTPFLFLGFLPLIISFFTGNVHLLFFGIIFTVTSGSDILAVWKTRKYNGKYLASDHPEKAGCVLFENPFI